MAVDRVEQPAGLNLPEPFICAGVDVGQQVDPTTIVVSEATRRWTGRFNITPERWDGEGFHPEEREPVLETLFLVRFATRLPLGTAYPVVALQIAHLMSSEPLKGKKRVLRVDITGVGRPVYELIEAEIKRLGEAAQIKCKPITFTHGDKWDWRDGKLGKAYGVSRLQALIQTGCIKVPANQEEVIAMLEELKVYQIKVDPDGNDKYGAFSTGKHDDLATGLMLSTLEDSMRDQVSYGQEMF